jgi:tetratricopeptide (TPR) repeat protein
MNESSSNQVDVAVSLIQSGDKVQAEAILKKLLSNMPNNWKPVVEQPDSLTISFWDQEDFLCFVAHYKKNNSGKRVLWSGESYSKALYYLAFLAVEMQAWTEALNLIDKAIALEPDHPVLLSEKAMIVGSMDNKEEAYALYMKAIDSRPWVSNKWRAKAMRGAAVTLIDLHRIDEAERLLKESLQIDPESKVARSELDYIKHLRDGGASASGYKLFR